ncbi:MAG: DUF4395 domain-containing protein [Actinomycetota bacterium]|nr:DUF4395 domain-containing protein [Actinomycetota bacterium]
MPPYPVEVDPRGLRVGAALTAVVLTVVLLTESVWLLAAQAVVFAVGAFAGVQRSPYSQLFVRLVRPRLGPPPETEDSRPPRFAQLVGLIFAAVGLVGFWTGLTILALVATGFALGAAFLNAAFGLCLGCEVYLVIRRVLPGRVRGAVTTTGASA